MNDFSLSGIVITLGCIFVAIVIHEMMHGLVALKLGDDLAYHKGRISLNPLKHIDPFLTLLLPLIFLMLGQPPILAAKPVPINTARIRGGDAGLALVAAAGPLTNLALAIAVAVPLNLLSFQHGLFYDLLATFFVVNIGLFVFNLLPIPPLDGSRVLYAVAPRPLQAVMEQIESFGLLFVFLMVTLGQPIIGPLLDTARQAVINLLIL